jgi:ParB-like chromosome segregation protein Spo0J
VLKCVATTEDDPTVDPRFGRVGRQRIEDAGPLTSERMETIDDETADAAIASSSGARRQAVLRLVERDESGAETGMYDVPAGGRRYRALELLAKQKRLARTAPVPCIIRTGGIAEEDSLAENVQRAPLHPLDQFRAFLALREKGQSEEDIAAAFFVSVAVVRQRLRLTSVSPKLLEVYAEDGMSLDQLMAFTVNPDHARQEEVLWRYWHSTR